MTITHRKKRLIAILLSVALLLSGCSFPWPKPLPAEKVKEFLTRHREDIDIVVDYLKELEYDSAFAARDWGEPEKIFYEFEWHDISSEKVRTSIRNLWRAGCTHISKEKDRGNTIYLTLWNRIKESANCGIACTIDGEGYPKTEFQISCEEIEEGWFYYYCNYEFYRSHIRRTTY